MALIFFFSQGGRNYELYPQTASFKLSKMLYCTVLVSIYVELEMPL